MSLRRKLFIKDAGLLLSLLLMIAVSVWGFQRQRQHVQASLTEYAALQRVEAAELRFLAFRQNATRKDLETSRAQMRYYKALVAQYDTGLPPEITSDMQQAARSKTKVILAGLTRLSDPAAPEPAVLTSQLTDQFAELLSLCTGFINRTSVASTTDLRNAVIGVVIVAAMTVAIALGASLWQYHRMMVPLDRLRHWCRRTAGGDFSAPYQPTTDQEYIDLGRDINHMADDLAAFYRRLEERVTIKSRQLAQSERLASVGYLAAGVAHEINTPLSIVSGYAELSIKRLRRPSPTDVEVLRNLEIIRGEAFRCKEITQKLLSLARGSGDAKQIVSMAAITSDVAGLVAGLQAFSNKTIKVTMPPEDACDVLGNSTELKQVLLNLVVNAAEAMGDVAGDITVTLVRLTDRVCLTVHDEGRGMTPEMLHRVFEPFFTHKRGAGNPGTGLGLSITHAIVADHGGDIVADSAGAGRGATFTVRLPAAPSIAEAAPVAKEVFA